MTKSSVVRDIQREFTKSEIIEIADELDLDFSSTIQTKTIVAEIMGDMQEHGVPHADDCSDLMFEFLIVAGITDEDGNLLEQEPIEDEGGETESEVEVVSLDELPVGEDELPDCYTYADPKDPACKRCKVQRWCMQERIANRPDCFGRLFAKNNDDCHICLEAVYCQEASKNNILEIDPGMEREPV